MQKDEALIDNLYLDREHRQLLNYSRLSILATLFYYTPDGLPYSYIKDSMNAPDGTLFPQITWLVKYEYIEKKDEEVEGETTAVYYLTKKGEVAYGEMYEWLGKIMRAKDLKEAKNGSDR